MSLPGQKDGAYVPTGLEHDEKGRPSYSPQNHQSMVKKRFEKLHKALESFDGYELFKNGANEYNIGLISWGSTEGPIREALDLLSSENISVPLLQIKLLNPLPEKAIQNFVESLDNIVIVEHNYQGQLAGLVEAIIQKPVIRLNKIEGIPFYPNELAEQIKKYLD